jgi:hypothetical protein
MKKYLLVRLRKRWPIIPGCVILTFFYWWTFGDLEKTRDSVVLSAFFIVIGILLPFRWGGED